MPAAGMLTWEVFVAQAGEPRYPCENDVMHLTAAQARRIILSAQGIGGHRDRTVGIRNVQKVITTVAQFQIDSVNVLARAHLMPLYTRLGAYDPALLDRLTGSSATGTVPVAQPGARGTVPVAQARTASRRLFEYWGHAASLIDISLYPSFQFRRDDAYAQAWGRMRSLVDSDPAVIEHVAQAVERDGPVTARDLDFKEERNKDNWGWNWSVAKTALEWLFWCGRVAVAGRTPQFERVYDIPSRVIPARYIDACQSWFSASSSEKEALAHDNHVELVRRAARALGVGTARCLGDYFRTSPAATRAAIAELVSQGELAEAEVEGIKDPVWVWHEAACPRKVSTSAIVSPFDSLVFERKRLSTFFHTDYSISLYTPSHKRIHGYYVYLFLLDDAFVARTDLKADRANGVLLVRSAFLETDAGSIRARVALELAGELRRLASWLALGDIIVEDLGDLAPDLRSALGT